MPNKKFRKVSYVTRCHSRLICECSWTTQDTLTPEQEVKAEAKLYTAWLMLTLADSLRRR